MTLLKSCLKFLNWLHLLETIPLVYLCLSSQCPTNMLRTEESLIYKALRKKDWNLLKRKYQTVTPVTYQHQQQHHHQEQQQNRIWVAIPRKCLFDIKKKSRINCTWFSYFYASDCIHYPGSRGFLGGAEATSFPGSFLSSSGRGKSLGTRLALKTRERAVKRSLRRLRERENLWDQGRHTFESSSIFKILSVCLFLYWEVLGTSARPTSPLELERLTFLYSFIELWGIHVRI